MLNTYYIIFDNRYVFTFFLLKSSSFMMKAKNKYQVYANAIN